MALILCDNEQERKYKALVSGKTPLESCLHANLSEHLNSEIGLGTITDLDSAKGERHLHYQFFNPHMVAVHRMAPQFFLISTNPKEPAALRIRQGYQPDMAKPIRRASGDVHL